MHQLHGGRSPLAVSVEEVGGTWPALGELMHQAGYAAVLAAPLRWRDEALGGPNLFFAAGDPLGDEELLAGQAFADALTLVIVNAHPVPREVTRRQLDEALRGRVVIEQAKGVLAQLERLSMEEAFDRLLALAATRRQTLTDTGRRVVDGAGRDASARPGPRLPS